MPEFLPAGTESDGLGELDRGHLKVSWYDDRSACRDREGHGLDLFGADSTGHEVPDDATGD